MPELRLFSVENAAVGGVSLSRTATDTTATLGTGEGSLFPNPTADGNFIVAWWDPDVGESTGGAADGHPADDQPTPTVLEYCEVSGRTGDVLTFTDSGGNRLAVDGFTPLAKPANTRIALVYANSNNDRIQAVFDKVLQGGLLAFGGGTDPTVQINASGTLDLPGSGFINVDVNGGVSSTDNLDTVTINGSPTLVPGTCVLIRAESTARTIVVRDSSVSSGNIETLANEPIYIDSSRIVVALTAINTALWVASIWSQTSSDRGFFHDINNNTLTNQELAIGDAGEDATVIGGRALSITSSVSGMAVDRTGGDTSSVELIVFMIDGVQVGEIESLAGSVTLDGFLGLHAYQTEDDAEPPFGGLLVFTGRTILRVPVTIHRRTRMVPDRDNLGQMRPRRRTERDPFNGSAPEVIRPRGKESAYLGGTTTIGDPRVCGSHHGRASRNRDHFPGRITFKSQATGQGQMLVTGTVAVGDLLESSTTLWHAQAQVDDVVRAATVAQAEMAASGPSSLVTVRFLKG